MEILAKSASGIVIRRCSRKSVTSLPDFLSASSRRHARMFLRWPKLVFSGASGITCCFVRRRICLSIYHCSGIIWPDAPILSRGLRRRLALPKRGVDRLALVQASTMRMRPVTGGGRFWISSDRFESDQESRLISSFCRRAPGIELEDVKINVQTTFLYGIMITCRNSISVLR